MHEFSMTSRLVESVLQEARKKKATRVLQVHLVLGKLTLLGREQVRFAYQLLTKGTILEKSRLRITENEPVVYCEGCGYNGAISYVDDPLYHISVPTFSCPRCGKPVRVKEGHECLIKTIRMVAR